MATMTLLVGLLMVLGLAGGGPRPGHGDHGMPGHSMPMVAVPAAAYEPMAPDVDRSGWRASTPPERDTGAARREARRRAARAIDDRPASAWHVPSSAQARRSLGRLQIDTRRTQVLSGLRLAPLPSRRLAPVSSYVVRLSSDGKHWQPATRGRWALGRGVRTASFRAVRARYVRITVRAAAQERRPAAIAELYLLGEPTSTPTPTPTPTTQPTPTPTPTTTTTPTPTTTTTPTSTPTAAPTPPGFHPGTWSQPIGLPIVPSSAVLLPNNKVLTFSGLDPYNWGPARDDPDGTIGRTQVSILDVSTGGHGGRREVVDNHHEMFCTGISLLADGRVVITGGSDAPKTTIYNPYDDTFSAGPAMEISRGYQTSVTLSDGRVFTVGGSWSDRAGGKDGEVLDAQGTSWTRLPGITATSILTDDTQGVFRADNHAWLFADRGGSVFHAGPSDQMNWFTTDGDGTQTSAGLRSDSADAMNGNAVLYDAGKIITLGGAPDYGEEPGTAPRRYATARAYAIDISGGPGTEPVVSRVGDLHHARGYANSVVLPDGKVVVTGGQGYVVPFSDEQSVLTPEQWDPATGQFTSLTDAAIPRNYHSFSLLLQDGRVLAGGGGLCGSCETNHADVEILTPPNLLTADGSLRARPAITGQVPEATGPGSTLTVTTDRPVASFALVRVGSSTHSVNSDQRRVAITPTPLGANRYQVIVPDAGVVVPGPHLLFALDEFGTPSVARWVSIS